MPEEVLLLRRRLSLPSLRLSNPNLSVFPLSSLFALRPPLLTSEFRLSRNLLPRSLHCLLHQISAPTPLPLALLSLGSLLLSDPW